MQINTPRTWTLRTRYQGESDLQVLYFPYQRQAYRFAIDWFVEDLGVESLVLVDDSGRADTLDLQRQ